MRGSGAAVRGRAALGLHRQGAKVERYQGRWGDFVDLLIVVVKAVALSIVALVGLSAELIKGCSCASIRLVRAWSTR